MNQTLQVYNQSDQNGLSSRNSSQPIRTQTLRYLQIKNNIVNRNDIKMSCIDTSRKILFKQISINTKLQELDGIENEMITERDKLYDAQDSLQIDGLKFKNFQEEEEIKKQQIELQSLIVNEEKKLVDSKLARLENEIAFVEHEIKQTQEDIQPMIYSKKFVNDIAEEFIYSRNRNLQTFQQQKRELTFGKNNSLSKASLYSGSNTFLTQNQQQEDSNIIKQESGNNSSDKDMIPFEKSQMHQFIHEVEESNLFLMRIIEDEEQQFKKEMDRWHEQQNNIKQRTKEIMSNTEIIQQKKDLQQKILWQTEKKVDHEYEKIKKNQALQSKDQFDEVIQIIKDMHLRLHPDQEKLEYDQSQISLQQILKQLEDKVGYLAEANDHIHSLAQKDQQLNKELTDKIKVLDGARKLKKYQELKEREKTIEKMNYEKNMERVRRTENVKVIVGRKNQNRSQKPERDTQIKLTKLNQDEIDFQKYVNGI
ncbi:UNKNOWN [Stylonychia lemnae]|uniref:DUF4200 domain-containing protein n=1 Tax=Stylonychia lemnae TaxID=5949 RepID=A0A077ZTB6_STYLE|nr:UNKNOWN [Stylonychia lemnae]|eukprot:CDW73133.1 UNKNOWN [Stylonychia lemnae]